MAIVRNPTTFNLYADLGSNECVEIPADGEIELADDVAARVSTSVFIVEFPEASAKPVRKTAARGAKKAEVTEAPEVETR